MSLSFNNKNSALLYHKALDISVLSQNISQYFMEDLNSLDRNGRENYSIYFTGDIIQQSVSLAPEILKAEQKIFQEEKYRHIASVERLTNLLFRNCERLEKSNSNGKDFLPILRKELKKFKKLKRTWLLTL